MAKQDVLEAIDATIIPNGVKGITADTLNSVLTMIVENAGEGGSGDGLLRLNLPSPIIMEGILDMDEDTIFNQATWDEFTAAMGEEGLLFSNLNEAVTTMFAQNAEVLEQIWSKFEEGKYPVVILDDSLTSNAYLEDMIPYYQELMPELTEEQIRAEFEYMLMKSPILGIPAAFKLPISEDFNTSRILSFTIYTNNEYNEQYPTGTSIDIILDDFDAEGITAGSMDFRMKLPISLYFPQDGATLSSDQKSSNVYDYYNYAIGSDDNQAPLMEYFTPHLVDVNGRATAQKAPFFVTADFYNKKFKYFDGLSLKEAVISSDGSVTVTTLGSLTAPTT